MGANVIDLSDLFSDFHSAFLDLASRPWPAPRASLLLRSRAYRRALRRAQDAAELPQELFSRLDVAHASWHVAEAAFFAPSPALALLESLREDFVDVAMQDDMVSDALERLRRPSAATDDALARDVFDLAARLATQGAPRDAGGLLRIVALPRGDRALLAVAELLAAYPPMAGAAGAAGAAEAAWLQWRARAAALREQFRAATGLGEPLWADTRAGLREVVGALLDVLCGDGCERIGGAEPALRRLPWRGTLVARALSEGGGGAAAPCDWAWRWDHILICSILFGGGSGAQGAGARERGAPTPVAPSSLGHAALKVAAERAMRSVGVDFASAAELPSSEGAAAGERVVASEQARSFLGSLLCTLDGDASAPLRMLRSLDDGAPGGTACGAAAAHLADLLWRAGHLSAAAPASLPLHSGTAGAAGAAGGFAAASLRAQLLLRHANALSDAACPGQPELARAAVAYAVAVAPEQVLALLRVPPQLLEDMVRAADSRAALAAEARAAAGASPAAELVAVLLATSVSRLPPELCNAKLALLSGALLTLAPQQLEPPVAAAWPSGTLDNALVRARTASAAPAAAMHPFSAAARAAAAALPFSALAGELGRASEEACLVDDAIAAASGHREEQLDAEGKGCLAPIPRFPELARSRSMQCVRHMRKVLALLASMAAAEAAGSRAGALASACAVSEGVWPLVRACGHHLAQICALPVDPFARPLADVDQAGRALRLALAAGLLHAFGLRDDDSADAPPARPSGRLALIAREDVEAMLVRVEVEAEATPNSEASQRCEPRSTISAPGARCFLRNFPDYRELRSCSSAPTVPKSWTPYADHDAVDPGSA